MKGTSVITLPDQNKKYGSGLRLAAALPLLVVLVALAAFIIHLAWPTAPKTPTVAADRTGTTPAALAYPGATDVTQQSGTLASMAGSNPFSAGIMASLGNAAKQYSSIPIVSSRFGTSDGTATVLQWFDSSLKGLGWCSPSSVNVSAQIHVYVHAQREAYAVVVLPAPSQSAGQLGSSVTTWYMQFPATGGVPAC